VQRTSASFSHPRDAAIAVVHRDGSRWRYDHATVASRDPRIVAWRSAATGTLHYTRLADVIDARVVGVLVGVGCSNVIAPEAAAVLPRATRFNQHADIATRRAHNQQ
jgi:hypothetical protein